MTERRHNPTQLLDLGPNELLETLLSRRRFMTRTAALGLAGVALPGLLAACADEGEDDDVVDDPAADEIDDVEDTDDDDVADEPDDDAAASGDAVDFVGLTRNQPSTMDPAIGADNPTAKVFVGVYEPLINHELGTSDVENLEGVLAESWEVSDDGMIYSFELREGITFHDGSDFDAEDVTVSYNRMKEIDLGRAWILDPVDEINIIDDYSVEIVLSEPYSPFLLGVPLIYIVSATAVEEHEVDGDLAQEWLNENTVGTGPYQLDSFEVGERVVIVRYDDYWQGWGDNHFDRIVLILVEEAATQRIMIEGGDGDWADSLSPGDLQEFEERDEYIVTADPTWSIFFLMMDTNQEPTNDPIFRRAMRYAFPYQEMVQDVMLGRGAIAEGYLPPGFFAHDGSPPEETDLDRAEELLTEGGYADQDIEISLIYFSGFDFERQGAELLAERLRPFGISVAIQGAPWTTMLETMQDPNTRPNMSYFSADPATADPDSTLYQTFHSESTHWSIYGYSNAELDEVLEAARVELDPDERGRLYQEAQALLQEDSPAINTFVGTSDHAFRTNVQGYVHHPPYGYGPVRYYAMWKE